MKTPYETLSNLVKVLHILQPRDQEIILARLGLTLKTPKSLESVGKKLGLSKERVRQIETGLYVRINELVQREITY